MPPPLLSALQSSALLDILTHHVTYDEILSFRQPTSLSSYGPPFRHTPHSPSTSPSLQTLLSKFALTLPGITNVPEELWTVQAHEIIQNFQLANLSESYDKGSVGIRKMLSTAASAVLEYPVRGVFGGAERIERKDDDYDLEDAQDLERAFRDFLNGSIYGTVLDEGHQKLVETDDMKEHPLIDQAFHDYVLANLASLLHFALILCPKGQYMLNLAENVNKLMPYAMIRQTLRIGNVATMMSALMRVLLAKLSISSVTNWMGLTQSQDAGMNLLQTIIYTVLNWDTREFESRASKIEKKKEGITKEQLQSLKEYPYKSREEQAQIRQQSQKTSTSIVYCILSSSSLPISLTPTAHTQALTYLSCQLSIRDRKEIIRVLCRSTPDHFTTVARALFAAFEPMIRRVHNAVDLSDSFSDYEAFVLDLFKTAKIPSAPDKSKDVNGNSSVRIPTVDDFVKLLKRHVYSLHKFLHQVCKNGPELSGWYLDWLKLCAREFRRDGHSSSSPFVPPGMEGDAGDLSQPLNDLFATLPEETQNTIIPILDQHAAYLGTLHHSSTRRLDEIFKPSISRASTLSGQKSAPHSQPSSRPPSSAMSRAPSFGWKRISRSSTALPLEKEEMDMGNENKNRGPGAYLAKWKDLMDNAEITPQEEDGEKEGRNGIGIGIGSGKVNGEAGKKVERLDPKIVEEALGSKFGKLLAERSCYW